MWNEINRTYAALIKPRTQPQHNWTMVSADPDTNV